MKKNFKIIFLLLVGILSSLPAMAEEYQKTVTVLEQGQVVPVKNLYLNPLGENLLSRIKVKNGVEFFIQLRADHQIENLSGGVLEENKIKVSKAGTLRFFFKNNGKKVYILADVNYFGILQYKGSDAPDEIEVTENNENSILSIPAGKFKAIWWYGKSATKETELETLDGEREVSLKQLKETNFKTFKVVFRDGTSNQLPNGLGGGESSNEFSINISEQPKWHKVNIAPLQNGAIVPSHSQAKAGTTIKLTITPSEGYALKEGSLKVTAGNQEIIVNNNEFQMPSSNVRVSAEFEEIPKWYKVTIAPLQNGAIVPSHSQAKAGTTIKLTTTPSEGYALKEGSLKVTAGNQEIIVNNNEFQMPSSNVRVSAEFEKIPDPEQLLPHLIGLDAGPLKKGEEKILLWEDLPEKVSNFKFKLTTQGKHTTSTGLVVKKINTTEAELQFIEEGKFTLMIELEIDSKKYYLSYDIIVEG